MAQIRCPKCGYSENIDLSGRFLVTCGQCGQKFSVAIVPSSPLPVAKVTCSQCGAAHELALRYGTAVQVNCQCGHQFTFTHHPPKEGEAAP